mgnify:CR=1 FL=1|jgi:NitT/TauT family transport system permease protein
MKTERNQSNLITFLILAIIFIGWEVVVRVMDTPVWILPAPSKIMQTLFSNTPLYGKASLITLGEALVGLLFGVIAGTGAAILLSLWPRLEQGVMTIAILVKSTPMVAIAPLLTIWLGFGVLPKVIITALLTFFPVLVNVICGLQRTDLALLDLFNSWHATRWEIFRFVRMPNTLPYLFAALKISAPLSLISAVVAEWTGASGGLGHTMWLAYNNLNLPFLFAAVFILGVAGVVSYGILTWAERRFVFWQQIEV